MKGMFLYGTTSKTCLYRCWALNFQSVGLDWLFEARCRWCIKVQCYDFQSGLLVLTLTDHVCGGVHFMVYSSRRVIYWFVFLWNTVTWLRSVSSGKALCRKILSRLCYQLKKWQLAVIPELYVCAEVFGVHLGRLGLIDKLCWCIFIGYSAGVQ